MPVNKLTMPRLMRLVAMLKENLYPNHRKLVASMRKLDEAGAFNISSKTVQRDVEYLNVNYSAHIQYDYQKHGYYLLDPEWTFDVPLLSETDMTSAVIGARFAESLLPRPFAGQVRSAVDKLLANNECVCDDTAALFALIATGTKVPLNPNIFEEIFQAWRTSHTLQLVYENAQGHASEMIFEPHVLAFHEGMWYIKGKLLKRKDAVYQEPRVIPLALCRIGRAMRLPATFKIDKELVEEANAGKLFSLETVKDVVLKLHEEVLRFARENFSPGELRRLKGGWVVVNIPEAIHYKLFGFIMSMPGKVTVLAPDSLRNEVRNSAMELLRMHPVSGKNLPPDPRLAKDTSSGLFPDKLQD